MEPDTVTTPKINKTTFKLGSGNLLSQVAKNTEKITLLRRIVTRQDTKISEGITPKIDSMQESMIQTNAILTDVASQLEKDFSSRLKEQRELLERERKDSDKLKRDLKEERLESKKTSKFAKGLTGAISKPFQSIFSKLFELATILGTGFLINNIAFNEDLQEGIKSVFDWTTKNWKLVAAIGGGLLALKLLGTVKLLLGLGKFLLKVVFSKAFIAAALFFGPGLYNRLDPYVMKNLTLLEQMGGVTKANRDKLIAQKQAELDAETSKNILLQRPGLIAALKKDIKFLQTGGMGSPDFDGEYRQKIDFEKIESGASYEESILKKGRDFHRGGYNPSGVGRVHAGEFVLQKSAVDKIGLEKLYAMNSGNPVTFTFDDLPPIDMRTKKTIDQKNNISATQVIRVSSTNNNNALMNEVPILFGFDNLVYT